MSEGPSMPQDPPDAVQTAPVHAVHDVVGSSEQRCEVCGAELRDGQRVACSDRCRARRWRRRGADARRERDREVRELLERALELLDRERSASRCLRS